HLNRVLALNPGHIVVGLEGSQVLVMVVVRIPAPVIEHTVSIGADCRPAVHAERVRKSQLSRPIGAVTQCSIMSRRAMSRELQLVKECGLEHVIPADVLRLDFGVLLRSATTVCAAGWRIAVLATIERMKVRGIRISPRDTVLLGKSLVDLDRKGVLVRDV